MFRRIAVLFFSLMASACGAGIVYNKTTSRGTCLMEEKKGIAPEGFEVVHGGYGITLKKPDRLGLTYLQYLSPGDRVLDLGAGLGVNTLPALEKGAIVTASDLSEENLDEIWNRCPPEFRDNLTLKPGRFPSSLTFPDEHFDVIIASLIMQFLPGEEIEEGVKLLFRWLKPNGKLYISVPSIHYKLFSNFLPIYEARRKQGIKWPGEVSNIHEYTTKPYRYRLPNFLHLLDVEPLRTTFRQRGFIINQCSLEQLSTVKKPNSGMISVVLLACKPGQKGDPKGIPVGWGLT